MYRKLGMYVLSALLILLPVSAAFGRETQAASSSRIAVIQKLSGDVQVQKAGGSKQFKAFAKLSLNQGDKLVTGSEGSAVLQFANGTSEDDKFTVGENATLTFSKLSDKKGTITKVSMLKGTAWVDVKSIKSKDDDFQLETPTAIMGVRGTAFFASVNPATGGTNTAVMSGVVRFTSENIENTGSGSGVTTGGTGSSGVKTIDLYPTQQISLNPTSGPDLRESTTLVDIEEIVKNASPEVIEAILRSKVKIDEENRQTVEKFKQTGVPPELQQSLSKFAQNVEELLGVIAKQAIEQKKIVEQQVKKIEEQEKTSFNLDKDRLSQLDEKEMAKLEKARQLAEEAAKKKAAEEAAKLKELADKINAAMLKAIESAKQAQDEANRLAAEAARKKAEEDLLKKLNDQQKQQYQQDKVNNQGGTTVTPGTNTSTPSSNANLGSLSISGATLSPSFAAAVTAYQASVTSDKTSVVVGASVQESGASFTINGQAPSGGQRTVSLAYGDNVITVLVTAQNGATQAYKVTVTRQLLNNVSVVFAGQAGIDIDFNSTNAPAPLSIPSGSSNLTLVVPVTGPEIDIAVNGENVEPAPVFTAARAILPDQISWRYVIPLSLESNVIEIKATIDGVVKSYKLLANRTMPSDAAVKSVTATSVDGTAEFEVRAFGGNAWTVKVPSGVAAIKLKINTINADAKVLMGTNEYASGAEIPYTIVNTTIPFKVRAADGTVPDLLNSISISWLPSSDASLSDLTLSSGTLSPVFPSSTTNNYKASVGNAVDSITVTPTASNGNASILVNKVSTTSGKPSEPISLSVGENQITIEVTAQNGSRQKYTIIVTREMTELAAPTFSPDSGEVPSGTAVTITAEGADSIYYTMDGSDPARSDTRITYSSDSRPIVLTTITIRAVALRAEAHSPVAEASYTVTPPKSQNSDLSGLTLSGASLQPEFAPHIPLYDAYVGSGVSSVTVTPVTADPKATVTVDGELVQSGQASGSVLLNVGKNVIPIIVTAESGMTKQYTITVYRALTTPVFTPASGVVSYGTKLTIESPGAQRIYYTTDGTDPATVEQDSTKLYDIEAKPTINASMTVKAIAVRDDLANSAIAAADYTVGVSSGLSELSFSEDVGNFLFSPGTFDYPDVTVEGAVDRLKVYPSGSGKITVNGQEVASGSPSQNIPLVSGGKTDIVIVVQETGKAPKTYTIKVERPVYTGEMPPQLSGWTVKTDQGDLLTWSKGIETEVDFYGAIVPESIESLKMTLTFDTEKYDEIRANPSNEDLDGDEVVFHSGEEKVLGLSNDETTRYEFSFYKDGSPEGTWFLVKVGKGMPDLSPIMTNLQFWDENSTYAVTPVNTSGEYGVYVPPGTTELTFDPDWRNPVTIHDENDEPFESGWRIPISSNHTILTVWISNGMAKISYKLHVYRTGLTSSLKLKDLIADGQSLTVNPLINSYIYTAPTDASTVSIVPLTSEGGEIARVIYKGTELMSSNGQYALEVPADGEAIVGIVVSSSGDQYAYRLVVNRLPSIGGLNGWSLHAGDANGPAIKVNYAESEGHGTAYASVGAGLVNVAVKFDLAEGSSVAVYDESGTNRAVGDQAVLTLSDGPNSFRFEITDKEGEIHNFYLDVIRGVLQLDDLVVADAARDVNVPYEKTGPQSYFVATNLDEITLEPSGFFRKMDIWANGKRLDGYGSPIELHDGWNTDIRIVAYSYNGGIVSEYPVTVWRGEGEVPGPTVNWQLRGEVTMEAEDPVFAGNKVAALNPENKKATIMPEPVGDEGATIERVYVDGQEQGQGEGIGTYPINLNVASGTVSKSTYVSLILKDSQGRLIPRTLEIVSGIYVENERFTASSGESKSLTLVAHTGSGVNATPNWEIVDEPAHGELTPGSGPNFTYVPEPGYTGTDQFTYRASYSWNDGEEHTLFSNVATVSIEIASQANIALSGSGLVDGNSPAGSYVGQLTATGDLSGPISYSLTEGEGADQNSLFSIDSEGRLLVGSNLGASDPELMSIRVKALDGNGHSIEKQLNLFYAINLEVLMNSTSGGGETGIVAGLLPGGDYWADGIIPSEELADRENFRIAISRPDDSWTISSEGRSFEYAGGRYYLSVDKPAAGSSHDYPIVMTDEQGRSFSFMFHYYQGPILPQLNSESESSGLRQSLSDGGRQYKTNIDVSEVLGWYTTVLDDSEQLILHATLETGVSLRVYDQFGRVLGTEDNMSGEGALEATIDLLSYGMQERYYVNATYDGNTIVYPLRVQYEPAPALTSLSLWYTEGSGGIPVDSSSYEMSVEIPSNVLIPGSPPYLPLGIEALAVPGQTVRVYRLNGEDWTEMELAPATNHDGLTKSVYSFDYQEPYQEFRIVVTTPGGQSATYYLSLMRPGYEDSV